VGILAGALFSPGTHIRRMMIKNVRAANLIMIVAAAWVGAWPLKGVPSQPASGLVDNIIFGNAASESAHRFHSNHTEVVRGGLSEPARRLLPLQPASWLGGSMAFTLKVNPDRQNYVSIRLWGNDTSDDRLILFCAGRQVGYFHLGDIDLLDFGDDSGEPACNGRFFYRTVPLPPAITHARTELPFEIRSIGRIWGYGSTFDRYQKTMTEPTRGIYRLYITTNGYFIPPVDEQQGELPANPPVRLAPGPEVLDQLKARVDGTLNHLLTSARPLDEMQMELLARAYFVKWTPAFHNPNVLRQVVKGLDALFADWRRNPALAHDDPSTPNPGWFEFGPAGQAMSLLAGPLQPFLDEAIHDGDKTILRRTAWSEMLQAGRDWHRQHRRLYSNQTMITDLNIYLSNRGLEVLDPAHALTEPEARRYLYEAVGLEPWRGSDKVNGVEEPMRDWGIASNYFEVTDKGLTRELGYVGYYGEVLDWVTKIYDATRPEPGQPGDPRIEAQLEKIMHARAAFRYPALDADGNRAMRIETIVGWRDDHYPGNVVYCERPTWDASTLYAAAATLDPRSIGYVQQMFDDNQFFASVQHQMDQNNGLRVTAGLLGVPDQYALLKSQPSSAYRLPMSPGRPDFVFSDEQDGVVAIKNGNDILYVSLYWRARFAVNFLARVHEITPRFDRIADVREEVQFEPGGMTYTRPDWINFGFGDGGPHYPVDWHSAEAGEQLPIARTPADVRFRPGDESVYAGKGEFYRLRYGDYLIGMNMTTDQTFELKPPEGMARAKDLVSGRMLELTAPLKVAPRSTVVLWLQN
jgi:hypothetical protein